MQLCAVARGHQRIHEFSAASGVFAIWSSSCQARVIRKSEQLGPLRPQLRQARDDVARIVRIRRARCGSRSCRKSSRGSSARSGSQRRLLRRILQRNAGSPRILTRLRRQRPLPPSARRSGPPARSLSVVEYAPRFGCGQQLVDERIGERRVFFVDLLQLAPCRRRESSRRHARNRRRSTSTSRSDSGSSFSRSRCFVDRCDARKEFGVQVNRVLVRGQLRRLGVLHLLQRADWCSRRSRR